MSESSFRINQPAGNPLAVYDRSSREVQLTAGPGNVELEAENAAESSYLWEVVSEPEGSSVSINNPTANKCNFGLSVTGSYLFRLTANEGIPLIESRTTLFVGVPFDGLNLCPPAGNETNQDNSQAPYDGARGSEDKFNALFRLIDQKVGNNFVFVGGNKTFIASDEGFIHFPTVNNVIFSLPSVSNTRKDLEFFIYTGFSSDKSASIVADGSDVFEGTFVRGTDAWSASPNNISINPGTLLSAKCFGSGVWQIMVINGSIFNTGTPAEVWVVGSTGTVFNHAPKHTDGSDDIQDATAAQKGLATATQITALNELKGGGNTVLHSHTAANTPIAKLGSPTDNANVQRTIDHLWSSAITEGMEITENPDGTVNIAEGEAMLRSDNDNHGPIIACTMGEVNDMVLVDNKTNFIFADYNGGSPQYDSTDDIISILYDHTKQVGHYCTRVGTSLDCLDVRDSVINFINHWNIRDGLIHGYQKALGNVMSIDGTHHILLTSGAYYILNVPIPMPAFDSNSETFKSVYDDGAGDWTRSDDNIIDYGHYDNLSGTLQVATSSKFTAFWAYAIFNTPGRYLVMYGREEYASAAAALDAGLPATAPPEIAPNSTGTPIYKIIYQANGTLISVVPIEQQTASGVSSTLHDQLPGLKGGEFGVFYHQSLANYNHETKGSVESVDVNSATKTLQPGEKFLNVIYDGVVDITAPDSELIIPKRSFTVSDIFRNAATVYNIRIWNEAGNLIRKINASGGQVFVMSDTTKWS